MSVYVLLPLLLIHVGLTSHAIMITIIFLLFLSIESGVFQTILAKLCPKPKQTSNSIEASMSGPSSAMFDNSCLGRTQKKRRAFSLDETLMFANVSLRYEFRDLHGLIESRDLASKPLIDDLRKEVVRNKLVLAIVKTVHVDVPPTSAASTIDGPVVHEIRVSGDKITFSRVPEVISVSSSDSAIDVEFVDASRCFPEGVTSTETVDVFESKVNASTKASYVREHEFATNRRHGSYPVAAEQRKLFDRRWNSTSSVNTFSGSPPRYADIDFGGDFGASHRVGTATTGLAATELDENLSLSLSSSDSITKFTRSDSITKATRSDSIAKSTRSDSIAKSTRSDSIAKSTRSDSIAKSTRSHSTTKASRSDSITKSTTTEVFNRRSSIDSSFGSGTVDNDLDYIDLSIADDWILIDRYQILPKRINEENGVKFRRLTSGSQNVLSGEGETYPMVAIKDVAVQTDVRIRDPQRGQNFMRLFFRSLFSCFRP